MTTRLTSAVVTMTIEEFGKYIECQNSLLIEEKTRKYSLVTLDDESTGSCTESMSKLIGLSSDHADFSNRFDDTPNSVKSPTFRKKSSPLIFLSSGSSEKKKEKIVNPFRSKLFRQKLSFNEIPEEDQCIESDFRSSLHHLKNQ